MDFLGLRNLTIIDDALDNIRDNRGVNLVLEDLELDDRPAYELLSRGDTLGVFQLDGGPMRSLLRLMKPDNFEDISALDRAVPPRTRWVRTRTPTTRCARTACKTITPIHPELAEPLRGHPRRPATA